MSSRFLENLSLNTLLWPLSEDVFRARYWEKEIVSVSRDDSQYYGDLFTIDDFDREISAAPPRVNTANAKAGKAYARYEGEKSAARLEQILADMQAGASLVLDQVHLRERKLGRLCRVLEQELGHGFQTNIYLTPAHGQGFNPHWDNHDVFILQVLGSKHWKVERTRRVFPSRSDFMGGDGREFIGDVHSLTLNQGDLLYIPRGFVHAAECGADPSMHITLGFQVRTWEDLVRAVLKTASLKDKNVRRALPLGFMRCSRNELAAELTAILRKLADEDDVAGVVDQFRDEVVMFSPLDISGQVKAFFHAKELNAADAVGPRPGAVFRLYADGDGVRINFGGRVITFPSDFKQSLEYALQTPAFRVCDIPGEVDDELRLLLIQRLMQEGLVVPKSMKDHTHELPA